MKTTDELIEKSRHLRKKLFETIEELSKAIEKGKKIYKLPKKELK